MRFLLLKEPSSGDGLHSAAGVLSLVGWSNTGPGVRVLESFPPVGLLPASRRWLLGERTPLAAAFVGVVMVRAHKVISNARLHLEGSFAGWPMAPGQVVETEMRPAHQRHGDHAHLGSGDVVELVCAAAESGAPSLVPYSDSPLCLYRALWEMNQRSLVVPGMRSKRRFGEDAAAQLVALLVAGGVFVTILGAVVLVTIEGGDPESKAQEARSQRDAISVAELLIDNPGEGWFGPAAARCIGTSENADAVVGDGLTRMGLGAERCGAPIKSVPGNLSYAKLVDLQRAALEADPDNGHLDYEEARRALGLDVTGQDLHIRTQPLVPTLRTMLAGDTEVPGVPGGDGIPDDPGPGSKLRDPNWLPMYIGDYEPTSGLLGSDLLVDVGLTDSADELIVWAQITNNGLVPTIYEVEFEFPLENDLVTLSRQSHAMAAGDTTNLTLRVPKTSDWVWDEPNIGYTVSDVDRSLAVGSLDGSSVDMTASSTNRIFDIYADRLQIDVDDPVKKVHYDAYDGSGNPVAHTDWTIEVYGPPLDLLVAQDASLHTRGWESFGLLGLPGDYSIVLKAATGQELARDTLVLVQVQLGGWGVGDLEWGPQTSTLVESAYVATLAKRFTPAAFSDDYDHPLLPYQAGGDVYPDIKSELNDQLPDLLIDDRGTPGPTDDVARLDRYNVIFLGSNVDHDALSSKRSQDALAQWVAAGGNLIVFGSSEQSVKWMKPIFEASLVAASGGLSIPDISHPILDAPNRLDAAAYDAHGLAWEFPHEEDAGHFTHVILAEDATILALSNHGAFGNGRVLLTAYQVYDLLPGSEGAACDVDDLSADCEALRFLHNILTQAYAGLFVDYGPMLPTDRPVGAATRIASVWHPQLELAIAVRVQVYVF